jgi:hypothetical protein
LRQKNFLRCQTELPASTPIFRKNLSTGVDKCVLIEAAVSYRQHPQVYEHRREFFFSRQAISA